MPKHAKHFFLAIYIPEGPNDAARALSSMTDMFRYDRCHPANNGVIGKWVVIIQPEVAGVPGGFTLDRWRSFGFRTLLTCTATTTHIPGDLTDHLRNAVPVIDQHFSLGEMR